MQYENHCFTVFLRFLMGTYAVNFICQCNSNNKLTFFSIDSKHKFSTKEGQFEMQRELNDAKENI